MTNNPVDLTNCDREPIHIPGQVQSHGFMVVVDDHNYIQALSENAATFIHGLSLEWIGRPVRDISPFTSGNVTSGSIEIFIDSAKAHKRFGSENPFEIELNGKKYNLIVSQSAHLYLLEFEPAMVNYTFDIQKMLSHSITELLSEVTLSDLLKVAAEQVKSIILYDRVMIYRFAEDGHGEVVAEAKEEVLEPWLGLHYPASDIPKQARELYKLNLTRLIANVHSEPSKIISMANFPQSLDLTNSQLRAVSPIHIQYLKNMGVASSFSVSLIYRNELWGLIACHNYTPKFIDFKARESAKLIGRILSSSLAFRQDEEHHQIYDTYKTNLETLAKFLHKKENIREALTMEPITLMNIVNAGGAALIYAGSITTLGSTPDDKQLKHLIGWLKESLSELVFSTDCLSEIYAEASQYRHIASGILVSVLSKELGEYIIWFKPEKIQTITWAGNPDKPVEVNQNGITQISPRHSFEAWSQTVSGTSEHWSPFEINSGNRLKEEVMYAVNMKAAASRILNDRLLQAYEELDTFSYTISHDLKNPIAAIRSYAQILERDKTLSEQGNTIIRRIAERADKMNFMIKEVLEYTRAGRSEIQPVRINMEELIWEVIKDLDQVYDTRPLNITIGETPDLDGDRVMMHQVFTNLIGNAVKYSQGSNPAFIHVEGKVLETEICYSITDNGLGIAKKDLPNVFELFNRMDNVRDIEGSGVGLAIVKRIVEKHKGKIWVHSDLGKGSTFYVSFSKSLTILIEPVTELQERVVS